MLKAIINPNTLEKMIIVCMMLLTSSLLFADSLQIIKTDGTTSGTTEVEETCFNCWVKPKNLTVANNKLFFAADSSLNEELWVTDGTTTSQVTEINTSGHSYPENLTAVGDYLFFAANDGTGPDDHGVELWFSDGTDSGTFLLKDIFEGPDDGVISSEFLLVGDNLFFSAKDSISNKELWRYYTK